MQRRRHINFVRSGARRPGARRWAVVCGLLLSLVAWGHGAGARGRDRDGGAGSEAGAAQAARLLADGRVALAAGDVATAYRLAAGSYRGSPTPDALALLGRVALAENRVVAAQDLMRRYLADPNLDAASESADQAEAQRILNGIGPLRTFGLPVTLAGDDDVGAPWQWPEPRRQRLPGLAAHHDGGAGGLLLEVGQVLRQMPGQGIVGADHAIAWRVRNNLKLDNLAGVLSKDGKPKVVNQISVHPKVRELALLAVDRMLSLSTPPAAKAPAAVD